MTTKVLIWGAIFAAGVYVGVQATKAGVKERLNEGADGLLSRLGLSPASGYGQSARTAWDAFLTEKFN